MQELVYLSRSDVEAVALPMARIIEAVEQGLRQKGQGQVEMPPKPGVHPLPDAFIHAMPAYVRGARYAGIKWVSGYPQNAARGIPYISGLLILNDAQTGIPLSVMDCTWITAMRTGAATAVAAKYLARPQSSSLGILGCGVQGHSNLLALHELFKLQRVVVFDTALDRARKFAADMSRALELDVVPTDTPRQAVEQMDLIVTAGPILLKPHATIEPDWMKPGAFAAPVDFDSYWSAAALAQCDDVVTDDTAQFAHYKQLGYFQTTPGPNGDLGDILTDKRPARRDDQQRIMCINLGLALEDIVVAPLIYETAMARRIGTTLPL